MKHALLLSLLLTFSATIVAQQDNQNEMPQSIENQTQQDYQNVSSEQTPTIRKTPQKGYKGNVELFADMDVMQPMFFCGISTSHGYQFSPKTFLGIGLAFMPVTVDAPQNSSWSADIMTFPFLYPFANFRLTPVTKQITPVVDLKVGYIIPFNTLKINPSVGVRLGLCRNFGINLGVGVPLYVNSSFSGFGAVNINLGIDF